MLSELGLQRYAFAINYPNISDVFSELFFKFPFDLVDQNVRVFIVYFQFIDYYGFGGSGPLAELFIGYKAFCEIKQQAEIKFVCRDSCSAFHGIEGIAFLFYMGRYHQDGFFKVYGFADRFKSRRACVCHAAGHLTEEFRVIQRVETQCRIYLCDRRVGVFVPEELQFYFRVDFMPGHDIVGKSRIEHIAMDIISFYRNGFKDFLSQERRYDSEFPAWQVPHFSERKSQVFVGPYGCDPCEEAQPSVASESLVGHYEIFMEEKILVPDAYLRYRYSEEHVGEAGKQFIEIHYDIRSARGYGLADIVHTADVFGSYGYIVGYALDHVRLAVCRRREEIDAEELVYGSLHSFGEEVGKMPRLAFPYEDAHNLVPVPDEHLFQGNRLCKMPSSFSLHYEQIFHG